MRKAFVLVLVTFVSSLSLVSSALSQLADSPLPMYQHDARHTGQTQYVGPENPVLKWKYHPDISFMTDPVVDKEGNIYFWNHDWTLRALNPDKTEKWRYTRINTIGDEAPGKPVVGNNGAIYFATKYYIYALNPSGHLKWTFSSETPIYHTSLFGNDGELYIYWNEKEPSVANKPKDFFGALSTAGKLKWKILIDGSLNATPAIAPDGSIILPVTKYRLNTIFGTYYVASGYSIYSLNPDGTQKWFLDGSNEYNDGIGSPVVDKNGVIYVVTSEDERTINAINPDGTTKWKIDTIDMSFYSLIVDDNGTLYVTYHEVKGEYGNSYLKAIDADGNEKWTIEE
ncbi:hypothetical protein KKB18_07895, partial [bacterium]|nr:hypothetical protein [bacterium]